MATNHRNSTPDAQTFDFGRKKMLLNFSHIASTTKAAGAGARTTVRRFTLGNVPSLEEGSGGGSGCV